MRKGITGLVILGSLLALYGCSKFKVGSFMMPSWDTQFAAPLFNRTYYLKEILSKDSLTVVGGDTTYLYTNPPSDIYSISMQQALKGIPVGDNLRIGNAPSVNFSQAVGDFTVDPPDPIQYIIPNPVPVNTTAPVPAFQKDTLISPQSSFNNYRSATISKGTLHLVVINGYPAPVGFGGSIAILDKFGNPLQIPLDTIPAYSSSSTDLSLIGTEFTPNPALSISYGSPGLPFPQTAVYDSSDLLTITSSFSTLQVSKANAIVPRQQNPLEINQAVQMPGGTKVKSAVLDAGSLSLSFTNGLSLKLDSVQLVIASLDSQNVPFKRIFSLDTAGSPGSIYDETINFSPSFQLNMSDPVTGIASDSLRFSFSAVIHGSDGHFVDIDSANTISASFSMSDLRFKSFTGVIHPLDTFSIAADTQKINLGDFKSKLTGGITLVGDLTKLNLNINRVTGFPYLVRLKLKPLSSATPLGQQGISSQVDTTVIIFPNQPNVIGIGPSFVNVLNNFADTVQKIPDEFAISGTAVVNPAEANWGDTPGTISDTDQIAITNAITMPLNVGIINASYTDRTPKPLIGDSATTAKMGEVDSGQVNFDITNGLPLHLAFLPELVDTTDTTNVTDLDSIIVQPATVFDNNGNPTPPVFSSNVIRLTTAQAKKFGSSYMRFIFKVNTPNGSTPVPFSANNTIRLKVYANLTFRIDKNLTGGK